MQCCTYYKKEYIRQEGKKTDLFLFFSLAVCQKLNAIERHFYIKMCIMKEKKGHAGKRGAEARRNVFVCDVTLTLGFSLLKRKK